MYIGIDLGTSGVKAVLVDDRQTTIGQASAPLEVSFPRPLWSEQDPESWWVATDIAMGILRAEHPSEMGAVRAIGLSGQMHGATLLDNTDTVLRPCILWNDGRSHDQCMTLESRESDSRAITGNMAMPGFTAPKLIWVHDNEPEIFGRVAKVLLPKDYLRLRLTGEHVSEMSDASGTLWLDVAGRCWSKKMLAATGLDLSAMPRLVEGSQVSGKLRAEISTAWGLPAGVLVAGGAGDNAAGAIGIGTVTPGQAFLSLGTSGVYFAANDRFSPNPDRAVHAFCHCLPDTWHQMSVILSAASCLSWLAETTGVESESALVDEFEASDSPLAGEIPLFLPYLTGERTPHNDPNAKGAFLGLVPSTSRADLTRSVMEGVAFAFADGQEVLTQAGSNIDQVSVIGGGSRSLGWGKILAATLGRKLTYHDGGEVGPAFGAARLARLCVTNETQGDVATQPPVAHIIEPDPNLSDQLASRYARWKKLYPAVKDLFKDS